MCWCLDAYTIDSLGDMLADHNSWVKTYKSAVDEIVRNDHGIRDAQICFGPVNRATHGPIMGELPSTSEIVACICRKTLLSCSGKCTLSRVTQIDSGRPLFVPILLYLAQATNHWIHTHCYIFSGSLCWLVKGDLDKRRRCGWCHCCRAHR